MLTQVIWISTIVLEALIFFRGVRGKLLAEFPAFYVYIGYILVEETARFIAFHSKFYPQVYWDSQFVSLLVGCGIIFEFYRTGLKAFPGTAHMARNVLLVVFALVFAKGIVTSAEGTSWLAALTAMKLELDLRIVQSCSLVALLLVFSVYAIPLSRNLKGVILGYGIFLGTSVIQLTAMLLLGEVFTGPWPYVRSVAYLSVLIVWAATLWVREEAPKAAHNITLDEDYNMLVANTRRRFQKTRLALGKVVRP